MSEEKLPALVRTTFRLAWNENTQNIIGINRKSQSSLDNLPKIHRMPV